MRHHTFQVIVFTTLLAVILLLTGFLFLPYISALFLAVIFAIVFWPAHRYIYELVGNNTISSLLSTIFVLFVIVVPLALFGFLLFQEISRVYISLSSQDLELLDVSYWGEYIAGYVASISPAIADSIQAQFALLDVKETVNQILGWLVQNVNTVFSQIFDVILMLVLALLALFYFFRDGQRGIQYLKKLSPLHTEHNELILSRIKIAVNSVIRGRILTAVLQGVLTAVAFTVTGVPAPMLWGAVAVVLSVIPMLGPALVIMPASLYLLTTGHIWSGAGLLIWGYVAIYFLDDVLGPILIERGMNIHPFIILISILGGITMMGPVGFVAGPVIVALLFVLLEMCVVVFEEQNVSYNKEL